jgi:hypothetical protein
LGLPLGKAESASSGDLVNRVTRDVNTMSESVRFGLPETVIAGMATGLTVVAMLLNSVLLSVPLLIMTPLLIISVRRYLKRAAKGYITEGGTYSVINTSLTETVEGPVRSRRWGCRATDRAQRTDIAVSAQAEQYTMALRNILFRFIGLAADTPLVMLLLVGGWGTCISSPDHCGHPLLVSADRVGPATATSTAWVAGTSRLWGLPRCRRDRVPGDAGRRRPPGRTSPVRLSRRPDVLHGIDPRCGVSSCDHRPSGSASRPGRLLASINGQWVSHCRRH